MTPADHDALVRTVLGEAANQGLDGMIAVANVIKNRAASGRFGSDDPATIALQPGQFSANNSLADGGNDAGRDESQSSLAYRQASQAVDDVLGGTVPDPTGGATYYHTATSTAPWDKAMTRTAQIGAHVFYTPAASVAPAALGPARTSLPVLGARAVAPTVLPEPGFAAPRLAGTVQPANAPSSFKGTSTGNTYVVGQKYANSSGTYVAQPNGTFAKVA